MVCESAIRSPAFRLVKDGAQLPLSGYTTDIPWRPGSFSGTALVDRVAEEHAAGATIVLQALHLHFHPAAVYCRGLESELGFPVQANAYCTPASAQGFAVHHDTHDVFVLQVSGHKRWRIYRPVVELPLKEQRWPADAAGAVGEPVHDITLRAGDTLYIPRGWPHEATAAEADSLHVTVGLHPPTRLDAVKAALAECAEDVAFRRALDAGGELPEELVDRVAARLAAADVARRARQRFVDTRRPILDGQLSQLRALDHLTLDTPLARRATVIADLESRPDGGGRAALRGQARRLPAAGRGRGRRDPRRERTVHGRRASGPARRLAAGWCSSGASCARASSSSSSGEQVVDRRAEARKDVVEVERLAGRDHLRCAAGSMYDDGPSARVDDHDRPRAGLQPRSRLALSLAAAIARRRDLERDVGRSRPELVRNADLGDPFARDEARVGRAHGVRVGLQLKARLGTEDHSEPVRHARAAEQLAMRAATAPCNAPAGSISTSLPAISSVRYGSWLYSSSSCAVIGRSAAIPTNDTRAAARRRSPAPEGVAPAITSDSGGYSCSERKVLSRRFAERLRPFT